MLSTGQTIYSFAGVDNSTNGMHGWTALVPSQRQIVQEWNAFAREASRPWANTWLGTSLTSSTVTATNQDVYYNYAYDREARIVQNIAEELREGPRITSEQRDEIELRAKNLLLSCLTPDQRTMYEREQKFRVVSNRGNVFELHHKRLHGVYRLDMQGKKIEEWCVSPHGRIPICDVLLSQKVMLESDEDSLRRDANVWTFEADRIGQQIHRALLQYQGHAQPPDYLREAI